MFSRLFRKRPRKKVIRYAKNVDEMPASKYEFIMWLDRNHPPRFPLPGEAKESWARMAGRRDLIDELIEIMHIEINPEILDAVPSDAMDPRAIARRDAGPAPDVYPTSASIR